MSCEPETLLRYWEKGISYQEYKHRFKSEVQVLPPADSSDQEKALFDYTKLNWSRSERVEKTFSPSSEAMAILQTSSRPLYWLVITEAWCGDSAQTFGILHILAKSTPSSQLRVVYRDSHPALMDAYLTNGSRSIPKLIIMTPEGEELATWGPRPAAAQERIAEHKANSTPQAEMYQDIHTWYAKDKGRSTEAEIVAIIEKLAGSTGG